MTTSRVGGGELSDEQVDAIINAADEPGVCERCFLEDCECEVESE